MDSFKESMVTEWLEQLDWLLKQIEENDDGDMTLALDSLSEGRDELKALVE